jgi:hypothetical protein
VPQLLGLKVEDAGLLDNEGPLFLRLFTQCAQLTTCEVGGKDRGGNSKPCGHVAPVEIHRRSVATTDRVRSEIPDHTIEPHMPIKPGDTVNGGNERDRSHPPRPGVDGSGSLHTPIYRLRTARGAHHAPTGTNALASPVGSKGDGRCDGAGDTPRDGPDARGSRPFPRCYFVVLRSCRY